jgi:anaerobic selenocysteine-containing dehydrogenase
VIDPIHGLPDQLIWIKLAKHMGFADHFPWESIQEGVNDLLSPLNLSFKSLSDQGGVYEYEERRYKKYESQGFHTPTGKVEIESERLKSEGYDPFPIRDNVLYPIKRSAQFPLFLTTGGNLLSYLHWQYRYIPKLKKIASAPMFEVHPRTALQYGIVQGEMAEVQTAHGKIRLKAHLTTRIRPDTIHIPQGWEEANVNELTGMKDADLMSGFPNLKSLRCRIQKI